jgi:hypothetical protein
LEKVRHRKSVVGRWSVVVGLGQNLLMLIR